MDSIKLHSLEGVRRKLTTAIFIRKATDLSLLTKKLACTSAGDNGAINVWIDDKGIIKCESSRYCIRQEKQNCKDLDEAKTFVSKWLKKIN